MSRTLFAAVCLSGCGTAETSNPSVTRTDSAGVIIVETTAPAWSESGGWTLSASSSVAIGNVSGDPDYLFSEIMGAVRLSGGRIAVGDRPSNEIKYYDADGVYLHTAGGTGEGPGEFAYQYATMPCGADAVAGFDIEGAIHVFDRDGGLIETVRLEIPDYYSAGVTYHLTCNRNGEFLANSWDPDFYAEREPGPYRTTSYVDVFAPDGAHRTSLGLFDGVERLRDVGSPYPLGKDLLIALGPARAYVGTNDSFEVAVYDLSGTAIASYRRAHAPRPYDEARLRLWGDEELDSMGSDAAMYIDRTIDAVMKYDRPEWLPAYSAILVDETEHVWVEGFRVPGDEVIRWSVFDPEGVWLGTVEVPDGFDILSVSEASVLARTRDDLGVERVVVRELRKP